MGFNSITPSDKLSKEEKYYKSLDHIKLFYQYETDLMANLANTAAILKGIFNWWWIGFYIVKENELVLGPFQGPVACTRITFGKGVCGSSWEQKKSIIVPDVHEFVGHIACSSASKSEIVVPVIKNNEVVAVLDADSEFLDFYNETDKVELEKICNILANYF
jgi:GAF domain-containing protein